MALPSRFAAYVSFLILLLLLLRLFTTPSTSAALRHLQSLPPPPSPPLPPPPPPPTAVEITCSRYAGPLRWRQHPGGRGAPTKPLRALPLLQPGVLDGSPPARRPRLRPFSPASLRLLPGGPFADAAHTNAEFIMSLPVDRLLWSFRATAGIAQPRGARPYAGCEHPHAGIRGHFVGHWPRSTHSYARDADG